VEETYGPYVLLSFVCFSSNELLPLAVFNQHNPLLASSADDAAAELQGYIAALDQGTGDVSMLKQLATFCVAHPSVGTISPLSSSLSMPASPSPFISSAGVLPSLKPELWSENRSFSRLFNALQKFLSPDKVTFEFIEQLCPGSDYLNWQG
jgi:CLIP-associating protein 1/2